MNDPDVVRSFRIPRALFDEIREWTEAQRPPTSLPDGLRYVLERGIREIKRERSRKARE
jgi:hypothetical protein